MIDHREWYQQGQWIDCRGRRIYVRCEGQGEPLLLIHGFPTSSWDWHLLWPELRQRYRVLSLDLLGFGHSEKPARHPYTIVEQADICEAALAFFGYTQTHVLAHDYGDSVAQELLARVNADPAHEVNRAGTMRSMVFLNGGLFPECHRPLLLQRLLLSPLGPLLARLTSKRRFAANMRSIFGAATPPSSCLIDGFWHLLQHDRGAERLPALLRYIPERAAQRERWVGALQTSRIPIAFINGIDDPISGAHMAQRWRQLLPGRPLIELAGIGHYPQVEAPDRVLAAYAQLRADFAFT